MRPYSVHLQLVSRAVWRTPYWYALVAMLVVPVVACATEGKTPPWLAILLVGCIAPGMIALLACETWFEERVGRKDKL